MSADDGEVAAGRRLARVNLWRIFAISALVTGVAWSSRAGAGAMDALRLLAIAVCCVQVYRGRRWALWLLGLLTVGAGALMVALSLVLPTLDWAVRVTMGVLGAVQLLAFVILVKAPEVRAYMAARRAGTSGG